MHAARVFRKFVVQKSFYAQLRNKFGLAAQPTILVIGKTADAYTNLRTNTQAGNYGPPGTSRRRKVEATPITFRSDAAQPFDARCLSWQLSNGGREGTVPVWTTAGRLRKIRIVGDPQQLLLLCTRKIGETDLVYRSGIWMLRAKQTSSARRLLKKRRRREARFASDVNHRVSKCIVAEAERTGRGIAAEQLTGIRTRVRLRKPQRATLHSWAFAQLGKYLEYKAAQAGVAFVQVDPAYTSQTCNRCGWCDRKNRRSQASFICGWCGFVGHADHNAARNIAQRGAVGWGEVMRPDAAPTLAAS